MVELERKDIVFHYIPSLEIGTGIRYLALSLAQQDSKAALTKKNQVLRFSASHDSLTGLYNRAGLMRQISDFLHTQGTGIRCVLLMADLDHLKQINDTFGHGAGDKAIRSVAETITRALPSDSLLGRTGGDEFTALVPLRNGYGLDWILDFLRRGFHSPGRTTGACSFGYLSAEANTSDCPMAFRNNFFRLSVRMKNSYSLPFRQTLCRFALFLDAKIDALRRFKSRPSLAFGISGRVSERGQRPR